MDELEGLNVQIYCLLARIESLENLLTPEQKKTYEELICQKREIILEISHRDACACIDVIDIVDRFLPEP